MADNTVDIRLRAEDQNVVETGDQIERAFDEVRRSIERAARTDFDVDLADELRQTEELRRNVDRIAREYESAARAAERAAKDFETDKSVAAQRRLESALERTRNRAEELVTTAREVGTRLPGAAQRSAAELGRVEAAARAAARALKDLGPSPSRINKLTESFGKLRNSVNALVVLELAEFAARGARALFDLAAASTATFTTFERLEPSLKGVLGSTELAAESARFLDQVSRDLRVSTEALIQPYLNVNAALKETGISLNETDRIFRAVVQSGRAFGLSADDVSGALRAIAQTAAKGRPQLEEFTGQLAERIPNAIPALARGLGVTIPEALALITSRTLTSKEALSGLATGLEQLNSEAARNQLGTLGASLTDLERATAKARQAFAEGFAPALGDLATQLTKFVDQNEDLITLLGEALGGVLDIAAKAVRTYSEAWRDLERAAQASEESIRAVQAAALFLGETFPSLKGAIDGVADALLDIPEKAEEAFQEIQEEARAAANDGRRTAKEVADFWSESFEEIAREAGASAEDIEGFQSAAAQAIAGLAEENTLRLKELLREIADAQRLAGDQRVAEEQRIADEIAEIEAQLAEDRAALVEQLAEQVVQAGERRREAERQALEEARQLIDQQVVAEESAQAARTARAAQGVGERTALEEEAAEKIREIRQAAAEQIAEIDASETQRREEIAREAARKVLAVREKLTEDIKKLEEERAKAAVEAREREIEAERKLQAELEKSLETIRKIVEDLKAVGGDGDEAGAFGKAAEDVQDLIVNVNELGSILDQLRERAAEGGFDLLAESQERIAAALGTTAGEAFRVRDAVKEVGETTEDTQRASDALTRAIEEFAENGAGAYRQLSDVSRGAVDDLLADFGRIAESGQATQADLDAFARALGEIFRAAGIEIEESGLAEKIAALSERTKESAEEQKGALDGVAESAEGVAESAAGAGEAQDEAGEKSRIVWERVEGILTAVQESTEGVAEGAAQASEALSDIDSDSEALEGVAEDAARAAEGVGKLRDAAGEARDNIGQLAGVAEGVPKELVAENQPEILRLLGEAALVAAPPIVQIFEAINNSAESRAALAELLPVIQEALPLITEGLVRLAELLPELDIQPLVAALTDAQGPLETLQAAIPVIAAVLETLPGVLQATTEAAEPLFTLVRTTTEEGAFAKLGEQLAGVVEPAEKLPQPFEEIRASLTGLADRREDIADALTRIAEGLNALGSDEVLTNIETLLDDLEILNERLETADKLTESIRETFGRLFSLIPQVRQTFADLANEIQSGTIPTFKDLEQASQVLAEELSAVNDVTSELLGILNEIGDKGVAAIQRLVDKVRELKRAADEATASLRDMGAAAQEAGAAGSEAIG